MKKGFLNGLNFIWQAMLVTGCGLVFIGSTAAYADEDDLVLKGPDNTVFEFRRVRVTGGKGPLDGQSFIMGDVAGDFRTPPTAIVIGGGFVDNESRYYYMGKYEVTVKQYKAVTGEKIEGAGDDYPVTGISWIEAQNFIDKLNTYLFEHELKALPVSGSYPGYVRLPTEEEWEFAARGGTKVESTVFDADTPYDEDDELSAYEWFSGPSSSHNKVQKVGKLKPNPLGLHDMLGNVQEMTSSLYRVEYYQGRSGGFTMRGGNYLTPEDDMVSSRRAEEPFYLGSAEKGMKPNKKATLGFRNTIGAPILTDNQAIADIKKAWEGHRSGNGAKMPAAVSVADVSTKESVPAEEALKRLEHISQALEKAGLRDSLNKELEGTRSALLDMAKVRRKADEDSARIWVKIACERGMYLAENLNKLEITRNAPTENLRKKAEQYDYNVKSGLNNYGEIMTELGKLPKDLVLAGFTAHEEDIQKKIDEERKNSGDAVTASRLTDLTAQKARIAVTRAHYISYEKEKRFNSSGWSKDYLKQ